MEKEFIQQAEWLKAIAHPVRLCILQGLIEKGSCNVTDMQYCLELRQSTLSMHLQKLRTAGIIEGNRMGLEVIYRIKDDQTKDILRFILSNAY
ncbi:metalloregulator ArsR/SmtB family transcription factor [Paenibacillus silvae]|uniref:ArsR/SmtB family transcription factor n=1 Tax=Paenibacillus silvae TaxID=1325358 RepID=UPI0025A03E99|nr:metalloregulator ArsR/SmtB family transcription factor [Paenibacillus silvae]MDM5277431.1 metalloregulator ArsR/SmtB family transcription factor [Paenibacillus silvae]